ncbi:MAG: D-hexose-6-phosphate mutarotase [Thermodesulfobacteriota bacterium]|nr:D-hexose-6-phosphate mutarotase [Thermodesulfobacteriota bacterium]
MKEYKEFENGFEYIEVANRSACAKIALQGAHLFHYEQQGKKPLLWLSETSFFEAGKAIRGGVPICWPWFGKHKTESSLPQHGFARTFLWELLGVNETDEDFTEVSLQLKSSAESLKLWPYRFELLLRVTVGNTLTIALTTKNCDEKAFEITSALHNYFAVANIDNVYVEGLDKTTYFDALTKENKIQNGNIYISEEVDRVYQEVRNPLTLHEQDRTVHICAEGSSSAVVWNPWIDKCATMSDMKDDAYKTMLCIETTNALEDVRILQPDEGHTLTAIIS